jgi:lysophospholipase L1-like esterase
MLPAKILLGPILLAQGRHVRRTALRLPEAEGPREGLAGNGGSRSVRLLFVGDSSAAGVGVAHQREAWAQPTAEIVANLGGHSVQWKLVAKSGINTHEALALLGRAGPQPAEVLVTALGVNDVTSQASAAKFLADTRALLALARERFGVRHAVLTGVPPMDRFTALPQPLRWYLGQTARALDAALQAHCQGDANIRYLSLRDPRLAAAGDLAADGYHPGPKQYRVLAQVTAREVLALLG